MAKPSNVIDLFSRRTISGKVARSKGAMAENATTAARVVDMTERRNERLTHERRMVKRTILSEFIGAFAVVPSKGLQRVSLYDISDSGVAFDIPMESGAFALNEEIAMRVYMNQQTYFPFVVQVTNARSVEDEGVSRHGATFVKGTMNEVALHHFVRFIESVSAALETDHGDVMVSSIGK